MSKRSKMVRYSPTRAQELRDEIAKCSNPMFERMISEGRMSDGDLVDFAFNVAHAYFDGTLLKSCEATQQSNLQLQMRWAVLVTSALFDATATFTDDETTITPLKDADEDTRLAAVQALVDVGLTVRAAMAAFSGPQGQLDEPITTRLPEHELVH